MAKQFLDFDGLALYDSLIKAFVNSKIFIGTYAEYETANVNGDVPINTLVIITDDESFNGSSSGDNTSTSTSSKLGEGVLGYMILG